MSDSVLSTDKKWTNKYKDTIHIVLQRLNAGFVVALCFFPIKRPQRVSTAVKIADHTRFLARIIIRVGAAFAMVVSYCLLSLW